MTDKTATRVHDVDVGELNLSVTEAGSGPAVVLLHGFPEIAYSWRHQIAVLAAAGYHVLAPDGRGYGWSDAPHEVSAYAMHELVGDVIGLLDAKGIAEAVIVGHDWGAKVAPWVALFRPDRVRGVVLMSVPFRGRGEQSEIDLVREFDPDGPFGYLVAFQEAGIEELFEADPVGTLRRYHWTLSGALPIDHVPGDALPEGLPPYLSEGDFENYYRAFAKSGFGNPINWYRNLHENWVASRPWAGAKLACPVLFVAGGRDFVVAGHGGELRPSVLAMDESCTDMRGVHLIEGAGHWVQQEAPAVVNKLLVAFLGEVFE